MTRPTKHPKTGVYQFRKAVPQALRAIVGKGEIKISLSTKDPEEARRKCAEAAVRVEAELAEYRRQEEVRTRPAVPELDSTTIKRVGEVYYAYLLEEDDQHRLSGFELGSLEVQAEIWEDMDVNTRHLYARGMTDIFFEDEVDEVLSWQEFEIRLAPTSPSRSALIRELQAAVIRAAKAISARNEGEPIETPSTDHIRPIAATAPGQSLKTAANGQSLTGLLAGWWKEAQATGRKPSTYQSYSNTIASFIKLLGHDDATRVTKEDVRKFKDYRLDSINPRNGKPISPKTVKDSDLAGLKAVFEWAVNNLHLPTNPAEGITIKLGKAPVLRSKGNSQRSPPSKRF